MAMFQVKTVPDIPQVDAEPCDLDITSLNAAVILDSIKEQYTLIFEINNANYQYYPTDILTVLNDVHQEWALAVQRKPHLVTFSGYPVLDVEFVGDSVTFAEPSPDTGSRAKPIGEPVWIVAFEEQLKIMTERILRFIRKI